VQIAESRAEQAYVHANRYARLNGGSGGGSGDGRTIRISGVKSGEVSGVTHFQFERVLRAVGRGCHVYLPGPPGTGKSHMALQVAEALGRDFSVSSFSPMSTESKLIGFRDAHGNTVRTQYRERYENGGIWCGDELDNSNPAVVAGLNSGLANGFMEFPDGTVQRHPEFVCIATANTLGTGPTAEFAGRQKLDPATLNRFVKIYIGTDEAMETMLVEEIIGAKMAERWLGKVRHIRRAVDEHRIKHFVTMRDSLQGARLIAPGDGKFTIEEALEMTILAVLSDDQRDKIRSSR
jgi:cobaltochelatase CobS